MELAKQFEAVASDTVVDSLAFKLQAVLVSADPALAYDPQLIALAATATATEQRDVARRLKAKFGKEFNIITWNQDVRDYLLKQSVKDNTHLIQSENGSIKANVANAMIGLRDSGIKLAYDEFANAVVIQDGSPWANTGAWRDYDDTKAAEYLQHAKINVASVVAQEAAFALAQERKFHPVREWLNTLTWDGTSRAYRWLVDCLGVEDSQYTRSVAEAWLISAVARIQRPGCKVDTMIVLEGKQGVGKSKALRALANGHLDGDRGNQWFRDQLPDLDNPELGAYMQGVWIIEVAELEAIRGKQWTRTKAFLSSQIDIYRRKYGRHMQSYPRQCVFAGTTNETHWGGDTTGLRRFWPVEVGKIDLDRLLEQREQLWAEAMELFRDRQIWWLTGTAYEEAVVQQENRAPDDAFREAVEAAVAKLPTAEVTISQVCSELGLTHNGVGYQIMRIGKILVALGYQRRRRMVRGLRQPYYEKT
jgi:predicted P-loop ATPase